MVCCTPPVFIQGRVIGDCSGPERKSNPLGIDGGPLSLQILDMSRNPKNREEVRKEACLKYFDLACRSLRKRGTIDGADPEFYIARIGHAIRNLERE